MSARTHFTSITTIEPIRDAVASGDDALVEALMDRHEQEFGDEDEDENEGEGEEYEEDEEDEEFREYVESMIKCPKPPRAEPGCWNYVITLLATHLGLEPDDDLPINEDWKHYHIWRKYRSAVTGRVTPEAAQSLAYLDDGRPLRGSKIDHDGCTFGWLAPEEVKALHRSLSALDGSLFDFDEYLAEFHEGLVDSLKAIADRNATLFMAAH
jgi:hypothetical protein